MWWCGGVWCGGVVVWWCDGVVVCGVVVGTVVQWYSGTVVP